MRIAAQLTGGRPLTNVAPSGYRVVIDEENCIECATCSEVCSFDAMTRDASGTRTYHSHLCLGCGLCVEHCKGGGLSLELDEGKGLPLDLDVARQTLGRRVPVA